MFAKAGHSNRAVERARGWKWNGLKVGRGRGMLGFGAGRGSLGPRRRNGRRRRVTAFFCGLVDVNGQCVAKREGWLRFE